MRCGAVILGLSIATTFISGTVAFIKPSQKWFRLRSAALELESEVWKFRTRTGYARDCRDKPVRLLLLLLTSLPCAPTADSAYANTTGNTLTRVADTENVLREFLLSAPRLEPATSRLGSR